MDEIVKYYAKWDKPLPPPKWSDLLSDKQMMKHDRRWEGGKNGGRLDFIEVNEGWGEGGGRRNNRTRETSFPYVNVWLQ